jgi:ATP-dependent Clp protease ATP-binding subunit ClpA
MKVELPNQRLARLNQLSEHLFGEASEVEPAEAEELLKTAGIDPARLKSSLHARFQERSQKYTSAGKSLPPHLRQALDDLRPAVHASGEESPLSRTARLQVRHLLTAIKNLPRLLEKNTAPVFIAAYRKRKELSVRDKKVLDQAAEDLRKKKAHE